VVLLPLLFACGGSLVCGPGTVEVDGVCRASAADEADADGGIASAGPDDTGRAAAVAATG